MLMEIEKYDTTTGRESTAPTCSARLRRPDIAAEPGRLLSLFLSRLAISNWGD